MKPIAGLGPDELRIAEIFPSLQGEASRVGLPTLFIRLTACDLRCNYCDAAHAFAGGTVMSIAAVLETAQKSGLRRICLTGGEPLLQAALPRLASRLLEAGCEVSCETHGGIDIDLLPAGVSRVVDVKTPESGEAGSFLPENIARLRTGDELKFVLSSRADYEWANDFLRAHPAPPGCEVLFSPVWDRLAAADLGDWIVADKLEVRLQVQLHKLLWGEGTRR